MKVEDLMSVALVTASPKDSMRRAGLVMKYADVRHLPVVDDDQTIVGIVSDRDLLRAHKRVASRPLRVKDIMTRRVRTVRFNQPAREAAGLMLEHRISALPVLDADSHLIGVISGVDFLRTLMR